MRVVILIPVYKRPEVLRICLDNLTWFISSLRIWKVEVVCILSPEDCCIKENESIVKEHGFRAIYYKNLPVSDKINAGIEWLMEHIAFDYLMNFGSDDLIHPKIERLYMEAVSKKRPFFGITKLFFYELATKKTFHFSAYNFNGAIGAGRMIHYSILERFHNEHLQLYEKGLNCGMDTSSAMSIQRLLGIGAEIFEAGEFPYIVDIKTDTNINLIFDIETRFECVKYFANDHLKKYYEAI